jgi:DNA-binding transcriptional regulator LsrR (DeoR family)
MQNEQHRIEEAAFLKAKGLKGDVIAAILDMAPAAVDMLLKKAKSQGILKVEVEFAFDKISAQRLQQLKRLDYVELLSGVLQGASPKLPEQTKHVFRQIYVVDSGTFNDAERMYQTRLTQFGAESSPILSELLSHSHCVGVSWGQTLSSAIHALTPSNTFRFHSHSPIQFLPICGEPYGTPLRTDSSSHLAVELDQRINKSTSHSLSLSGVPAVISKEFMVKDKIAVIQRFIRSCPAYREIFGDPEQNSSRLIDTVDTILTSVGTLTRPWRMCGVELCEIGGIERQEFQDVVLGDIGGVLIHKNDKPSLEELDRLAEMQKLWTGIQGSDYLETARKTDHNRQGVIVLAIGANKAKIIHRCVKQGLINRLICDEPLAWALCKETGARKPENLRLSQ